MAEPPSSAEMRFGKIDDIKSRIAAAIGFFPAIPLRSSGPRGWLLVRRTGRRHHAGLRLHPAASAAGYRGREAHAEVCHRDPEPAEPRWRLADLQRWAVKYQRVGEGILRVEDGGVQPGPSAAEAGTRAHPGARRRDRGQHLYQDLSLLSRSVRLRRGSGNSAGDRAVPQLVLVQSVRNFIVVARHPGAVVDRVREEAVQENSGGAGYRRAVRRRPQQEPASPALGGEADQLAQLLPGARPADSLLRAGSRSSAAFACA